MNTGANERLGEPLPDSTAHEAIHTHAAAARMKTTHSRAAWLAPIVLIAAWAVPGLGHALLRRWARALGFFVAAGGLAVVGYAMRGQVFGPHAHESFGTLGFLADSSSGVFYFIAHVFETAGPDISRATGNYATRFVAAAGLVNLIGMIDALELVLGRRA